MFNIIKISSALILLLLSSQAAFADFWNLPQELDDQNTQVTFEVDSTWHTVHGVTKGVAGKIWLSNPKDHTSLNADIRLPVAMFNTDNSSRDERLAEVMAAEKHPQVLLRIASAPGLCTPPESDAVECKGELLGTLEIRGVAKELRFPYQIKKDGDHYNVSGELSFKWGGFGVEDPSILIARVKPDVIIRYQVRL